MIKSKKEGRFLVFHLGEDKGCVKYDLATKEYIGKRGKPVTNLCSQLKGYSINEVIDSFEDDIYKRFLNCVKDKARREGYFTNVGTFLTRVADYSNYEQFFSAGLFNINLDKRMTISQIPKPLIKICKENQNITLTRDIIKIYTNSPSLINLISQMKEEGELELFSLYALFRGYRLDKIIKLVEKYNYKPKSLIKYMDNIMVFEGINSLNTVIDLLYDYVEMSSKISERFEKYPRYLKTIHDIAVRNYNRLKQEFDERAFATKINRDMEFKYKHYVFLYPNTTQDIKDEAVQQSNCVASYIERVLEDKCHIMFMRNKGFKDKSLVTLEIGTKHMKVVQARGGYNRDTTSEEKEAIDAFNNHLESIEKSEK